MDRRIIAALAAGAMLVGGLSSGHAQGSGGQAGGTSPAPALPLSGGGTTRDITAPGNGGVAGTGLGGSVGGSGDTGSGSSVKGPPGQGIQGEGGGGLGPTGGPSAGQGGVAGGGGAPAGDNGTPGAPLNK